MSDSKLPTTRKGAQRSGSNKYKTGKPCRVAGHTGPRYTDSGACCECISSAGVKARYGSQENKDIAIKLREARQAVVDELIGIRLRCYMEDLDKLRSIVVEGTRGRWPILERDDIIPRRAAGANEAGTALFWFNVAATDVEMFRSIANNLLNTRGPDLSHVKAKILASVLRAEEMAADPAPPFVP